MLTSFNATRRDRLRWITISCLGLAVLGEAMVSLGVIFGFPLECERLGITNLGQRGTLQTVILGGLLTSSLILGPLSDRFGHKPALGFSALFSVVGLLGISLLPGFGLAIASTFLLGFGAGGLNTCGNALACAAYPDDRTAKLNLVGACFGASAISLPALIAATSQFVAPGTVLAFAAIVPLALMLLILVTRFPSIETHRISSAADSWRVIFDPVLIGLALLLCFESGNETLVSGWTSTWARGVGASPKMAILTLALFQTMMMGTRLLMQGVLRRTRPERILIAGGVVATLAAILCLVAPNAEVFACGIALIGIGSSLIYPTAFAFGAGRHPRRAGTVISFLFSVGMIGGMFEVSLNGQLAMHVGQRSSLLLLLVATLGLLVTAIATSIVANRRTGKVDLIAVEFEPSPPSGAGE